MSEKLFDALEICLQAIENGETVDAALARFPALAADLRPMLAASHHARTLGGLPVPDAVQRRSRSRLLQQAAQMREAKRAPRRTWLYNFRPLAVTLMLALFFLSGTGLVRASTATIPGDSLYPVKRTWEDVRLIFTFNEETREGLELEYEGERVDEIDELLVKGRMESVVFSGFVTAQTDGQWTVSGIPVILTEQTILPLEPITVGSAVTVTGATTTNGSLQAQSIVMVPTGTLIPTPRPDDGNESEGSETRQETGSGSSSGKEAGESGEDSQSAEKSQLKGVVESINGTVWVVNGQTVNVSGAEIVGTPAPGANVTIEGYVDASGVFVVTKAVFGTSDGGGDGIKLEDGSDTSPTNTPAGDGGGETDTDDD